MNSADGELNKIILLVVDSLGHSLLHRVIEINSNSVLGQLATQGLVPLTSTFPSATSTAMTIQV